MLSVTKKTAAVLAGALVLAAGILLVSPAPASALPACQPPSGPVNLNSVVLAFHACLSGQTSQQAPPAAPGQS